MTVGLAILLGALTALLLGMRVAARSPRRGVAGDPPEALTRELAGLREDLQAGEIDAQDYALMRDRLAARVALADGGAGSAGQRRRWLWPLTGGLAAAVVAAALVPALRQREPGGFFTGNDFSAANRTGDSGAGEWTAAERALAAGDVGEAITRYRIAVAFLSERADLRARFGFALARNGRVSEAIDQLRRAVRTDPKLAAARLYLGAVLLRDGQRSAGRQEWRRFLELQPTGADAALVRRTLRRLKS